MEQPKLKGVEKYKPEYPLNKLPKKFAMALGKELIYLLATRSDPRLEGSDWEEIFARCVGADWRPSNVGLDDVVHGQMAWGAKTVKNAKPFEVKHVRLICGRNSPDYSFKVANVHELEPNDLGTKVLQIWNGRLAEVRKKFTTVRTVVLLKGKDLSTVAVYEEDAVMFLPEEYYWEWNEQNNLEGYEKKSGIHRFSWQPHGSQFTVISEVPTQRLKLRIKRPPLVDKGAVLKSVQFDESWIEIVK